MKKGQITFYMIVIVVACILLGLAYVVSTRTAEVDIVQVEMQGSSEARLGASGQVQSCLDVTLREALEELGKNGGFLFLPPDAEFQYTDEHKFVVLFRNKQSFLPSKEKVESDLQRYIAENVRYCVDDFLKYQQQNWVVEVNNPGADVTVDEESVKAVINFPARFSREGASFSLNAFTAEEQVPLQSVLTEVAGIISAANDIQGKIDDAKASLKDNDPSNDVLPQNPIPRPNFEKNGVAFENFHYPGTGRFLWIASKDNFEMRYGVNIEI